MKHVNVHWISTFELLSSCHKRHGLLTYLFYCSCSAVAWNQLSLKDWINFGIYWKKLLSHSQPWPWVCGLGLWLGLACIWPWPWLTGLVLRLGLDTSGLVNITVLPPSHQSLATKLTFGLGNRTKRSLLDASIPSNDRSLAVWFIICAVLNKWMNVHSTATTIRNENQTCKVWKKSHKRRALKELLLRYEAAHKTSRH